MTSPFAIRRRRFSISPSTRRDGHVKAAGITRDVACTVSYSPIFRRSGGRLRTTKITSLLLPMDDACLLGTTCEK